MVSDDGTPILMDFGSTMKARIPIENRSQALLQQARLIISRTRSIFTYFKLACAGYCC